MATVIPWAGSIYSCNVSLDGYVGRRGGQLRLVGARGGGPRARRRPDPSDGHAPVRAPHVRGHGVLGDRRRPRSVHGRLRAAVAGRREDRLLPDARRAVHRPHPHRARLRRRHGPGARRGVRHRRADRRAPSWPGRPSPPGWSTRSTPSSTPCSSAAARAGCPTVSASTSSSSTSTASAASCTCTTDVRPVDHARRPRGRPDGSRGRGAARAAPRRDAQPHPRRERPRPRRRQAAR